MKVALSLAALLSLAPAGVLTTAASAQPTGSADYVVVVHDGFDPGAVAHNAGVSPSFVYRSALKGFAARLVPAQVSALQSSSAVAAVTADDPFSAAGARSVQADASANPSSTCSTPLTCQVTPSGVRYISAGLSSTAKINGIDQRVDSDVAVIDSGIDATNPDLNVVGGYSCVPGKSAFEDGAGHGTGVAGVIGALDNGYGVVGVAPGARLWSVRVLDDQNAGTLSQLLCGVDWVMRNSNRFDVANMSIEKQVNGTNDNCGQGNPSDTLHQAVCRLVSGGVPVVAAAGNYFIDASHSVPAAYHEVIAVSALTDFDGVPYTDKRDPRASDPCTTESGVGSDDTFAAYSDWGPRITLIAPGTCLLTTGSAQDPFPRPMTYYNHWSGTSFAAPHVTGTIALLKAHDHGLTPDQVRSMLTNKAIIRPYPGDPDGITEPTVDAAGF